MTYTSCATSIKSFYYPRQCFSKVSFIRVNVRASKCLSFYIRNYMLPSIGGGWGGGEMVSCGFRGGVFQPT